MVHPRAFPSVLINTHAHSRGKLTRTEENTLYLNMLDIDLRRKNWLEWLEGEK
jgi:hypothetical protein